MTGRLAVVGLGPGDARWLTPEAETALSAADALFGYGPYLDRAPVRAGQGRHASDNREEGARAGAALGMAAAGAQVAWYPAAIPACSPWRPPYARRSRRGAGLATLDLTVVPGITAMLAAAARVGAPLGHDFCAHLAVRQSEAVGADRAATRAAARRRIRHRALQSGLAGAALATRPRVRALARHCPATTPVIFGRAIGRRMRDDGRPLARADPDAADMATLIIIGSARDAIIERPGSPRWSTRRGPRGARAHDRARRAPPPPFRRRRRSGRPAGAP